MRGGYRPGSGRKYDPDHKEVITVRLPQWLIKWLKERNQSRAIEDALIKANDLTPPLVKGKDK